MKAGHHNVWHGSTMWNRGGSKDRVTLCVRLEWGHEVRFQGVGAERTLDHGDGEGCSQVTSCPGRQELLGAAK